MSSINKRKVLFLVEGEDMEPYAIENVAKKMFGLVKEDYKICVYGTTIYELYDELKNDDNLSTIGLLVEKGKYVLNPGELSKNAFSQIYLVFDFEPHYQKYDDVKIKELLNYFNDETENGKLYINYPMFEAAFYIDDFEHPTTINKPITLLNFYGSVFKKNVKKITCFGEKNHIDLKFSRTEDIWYSVKWNYVIQKDLTGIDNFIDYNAILKKQIEMKNNNNCIIALSTFVLLIIDYNPGILKFLEKKIGL